MNEKIETVKKDMKAHNSRADDLHIAYMLGYDKAKEKFERKHGRWKDGCCTVCGESAATDGHFDFIPEEEQKYCWNCGAIMDGENK